MWSQDKKENELFHVIHKVPVGDSLYVRAKHVQLIEKDPSRAISLFWAAINAGDRVDSALKDMAVVMQQLDRFDEAIEAIKSFRHLCTDGAQESVDNILLELYKRTNRIEEEIELLQRKLKNTEEVIASGGKSTKIAKSQGKKIQISVVQELSRILGNLAWAYLQQNDYESAEQYYMKALSLEPDKNKQCNLAICLMCLNRIAEAKSLLEAVKASSGNGQMDDSFSKSFERAFQMLSEFELQSVSQQTNSKHREILRSCTSINGCQDYASGFTVPRRGMKDSYPETPCGRSGPSPAAGSLMNLESPFTQPRRSSWRFNNREQRKRRGWKDATGTANCKRPFKQTTASENMVEPAVLFTQPRSSWGSNRRGRWREDATEGSNRKLSFETAITTGNLEAYAAQNFGGAAFSSPLHMEASTNGKSELGWQYYAAAISSPTSEDWRKKSWRIIDQVKQKQQCNLLHCR